MTNPLPARPRHPRGILHDLLLRLYAYGPAPIASSRRWRRDLRLAKYALRRDLVELADDQGPLGSEPWRIMRPIRLTPLGRTKLRVPPSVPREDEPVAVLRDAVAFFLGDGVEIEPDPTHTMLARTEHWCDEPTWVSDARRGQRVHRDRTG